MKVESESPAALMISSVSKSFIDPRGREVKALRDVTLSVGAGEFVVLLGPSGCGKTTLLRSIAGFESIDHGSITLGALALDQLPANKRPVNTVFQSYALFPHMSVAENIAFGLESEGLAKASIEERVREMLELVRLVELADRKPRQMSGGQQQRAALARALAKKPSVLLLDEPLAALDLKLRRTMQTELKRIHKATGTTFLLVTHDQTEAMALGERIAVFSEGEIRQFGTPEEIYENPRDEFVASFIGESTSFLCSQESDLLIFESLTFPRIEGVTRDASEVHISVRPEDFSLQQGGFLCGRVVIADRIFNGNSVDLSVRLESGKVIKILAAVSELRDLVIGNERDLFVNPKKIHLLRQSGKI